MIRLLAAWEFSKDRISVNLVKICKGKLLKRAVDALIGAYSQPDIIRNVISYCGVDADAANRILLMRPYHGPPDSIKYEVLSLKKISCQTLNPVDISSFFDVISIPNFILNNFSVLGNFSKSFNFCFENR